MTILETLGTEAVLEQLAEENNDESTYPGKPENP